MTCANRSVEGSGKVLSAVIVIWFESLSAALLTVRRIFASPAADGVKDVIMASGLAIVPDPETRSQCQLEANRLFSAVRVAAKFVLAIRFGPGFAIGRPGLSAAPLESVAVCGTGRAPSAGLMAFASCVGALELQKSLYTM